MALGFGGVLLFPLILGLVSALAVNRVSALTKALHDHPFTVSIAIREIHFGVSNMHRFMKDVLLAESEMERTEAVRKVDETEKVVLENFTIVFDRYLGNRDDVQRLHEDFLAWEAIRNEIVQLAEQGMNGEALALHKTKASPHVHLLESEIKIISAFARNKAASFMRDAITTKNHSLSVIYAVIIVMMALGLLVSIAIARTITDPLQRMVRAIGLIATGTLEEAEIPSGRQDEIGDLATSLHLLVTTMQQTTAQAKIIASGNYLAEIEPRSAKDALGSAMQVMTHSLRQISRENEISNWLKNGQAALDDQLRGELSTRETADRIIRFVCDYLQAKVGGLYVNAGNDSFCLLSSFAYSNPQELSLCFRRGEGLIGQAVLEEKAIFVANVPDDYLKITSGLGERRPLSILVVPFIHDKSVTAVLEIGSFEEFTEVQLAFIKDTSERLAIAINSAQSREKLQELLETTQRQAEELQTQQEELRVSNEELEAQTTELKISKRELQSQQEELSVTNEELEAKTNSLVEQKAEIEAHNLALASARSDIEQKAQDLAVASKYKSEFLANMSHELRTPLNSLLLLARSLTDNRDGNLTPDQIESAKIIEHSGHELLNLINEILDLSKIEAGRMDLEIKESSIQTLADNIKAIFQPVANDKGISLTVTVSPDLPATILTDSHRLEQILKNLLSNALKFTTHGGVAVTFAAPTSAATLLDRLDAGHALAIAVTDTGIGISPENQQRIFHAFHQADGSTARRYGGTGLGLSISTELARLLGGEIRLQSEVGKGSTFTLLLPLRPEQPLPAAGASPLPASKENGRSPETTPQPSTPARTVISSISDDRQTIQADDKVVLVIEDDENFARILYSECHAKKFKCLLAPDGEQGLLLADEFSPVAIILDINLPGMNGWSVLDRLKKNSRLRHIPVHMMSVEEATIDAMKKGAISFLTKPVSEEALQASFARIEKIIDREISTLLVVEDNDTMRRQIIKLIGNGDVKSSSATTGAEALASISSNSFDCMVLDLGLPDMSGFDLLDRLEADHIDIPPVVIYTGRELSREESQRLQHYTESIIIKGVKSEERLLDETALFLHRMVDKLPEQQKRMIASLHDQDQMFAGQKILVVDDDMRNTFALAKILREKHCEVTIASDGQQALAVLAENKIDLVLMDIMMPVMDGYETIGRIRAQDRFWNLPIIALTAKAMKEDRERCMQVGASDYLSKPVDVERLLSMMRIWLYR